MPPAITAAPAAGGRSASQARRGEVAGMVLMLESGVRRADGARAGQAQNRLRARAARATDTPRRTPPVTRVPVTRVPVTRISCDARPRPPAVKFPGRPRVVSGEP